MDNKDWRPNQTDLKLPQKGSFVFWGRGVFNLDYLKILNIQCSMSNAQWWKIFDNWLLKIDLLNIDVEYGLFQKFFQVNPIS